MGDDILRRLREAAPDAFEGTGVLFAYLFGSVAREDIHPHSDVDVAVYLKPAGQDGLTVSLRLADRLATASGVGGIEVTVLNHAPLPLRGRAVRERRVFYSRDEPTRVEFESRTLREFFDFEIHARALDRELLRRIADGRR
ncbi:MAG: nucleotidyltransferase domain-containing protein [Actinobacteria bacterium]|nr:nucleotidyltransferase domain-containing protein [Actinomycetota bacterium]